jgi:hypothetical protein
MLVCVINDKKNVLNTSLTVAYRTDVTTRRVDLLSCQLTFSSIQI